MGLSTYILKTRYNQFSVILLSMKMGREMELINKYANPQIFPKFYAIALIYNISTFLAEQMEVTVCLGVAQHSSLSPPGTALNTPGQTERGGRVHN